MSDVQRVRFLTDDIAIVHSTGSIAPAGCGEPAPAAGCSEPAPESRSRETWVLSRREDGWRVAAYQSSPEHAA